MNHVLSFFGEATWGSIPISVRLPLWWTLLVIGISIILWIVAMLPKTSSQNIRGYRSWGQHRATSLAFSENGGIQAIYPEEVAQSNRRALFIAFLVALFLLFFPVLRSLGASVFQMERVISKEQEIRVPQGDQTTVRGILYTCTKTVQGPAFFYRGRWAEYTMGDTLSEQTERQKTATAPTWWGFEETVLVTTTKHTCQP